MHCTEAPTGPGIYLIRSTQWDVYETVDLHDDPYEIGELMEIESTYDVYKVGSASNLSKRLQSYIDNGYVDSQITWIPLSNGRHLMAERLLVQWLKSICYKHKGREWHAVQYGYHGPELSWINMVKIWSELRKIRHTDDLFAEYHFWECLAHIAVEFELPFIDTTGHAFAYPELKKFTNGEGLVVQLKGKLDFEDKYSIQRIFACTSKYGQHCSVDDRKGFVNAMLTRCKAHIQSELENANRIKPGVIIENFYKHKPIMDTADAEVFCFLS